MRRPITELLNILMWARCQCLVSRRFATMKAQGRNSIWMCSSSTYSHYSRICQKCPTLSTRQKRYSNGNVICQKSGRLGGNTMKTKCLRSQRWAQKLIFPLAQDIIIKNMVISSIKRTTISTWLPHSIAPSGSKYGLQPASVIVRASLIIGQIKIKALDPC